MPLSVKTSPLSQPNALESLADRALELKQAADNAALELDLCKAQIRDAVDLGLNGTAAEAITETAWLRVQRSGKYSAPTAADLEPFPPAVCDRLWRTTHTIRPKPRANFSALLALLEKAGIDHSKYFDAAPSIAAVPKMGEAADFVADELTASGQGELASALVNLVKRLEQAPTVIIRSATDREPK